MTKWHIGHIFALAVLAFFGLIFIREMQVVLLMIETEGFDPIAYNQPTYKFAIRAIIITLYTIFVAYKSRVENPIVGNILLGVGAVFFLMAVAMMLLPRDVNILYLNRYWMVYSGLGVFLSIIAILGLGNRINTLSKYEDDILDDLL